MEISVGDLLILHHGYIDEVISEKNKVRKTLLTQYSGYLLADKQYEKVVEVLTSDLAFRQPLTPGQLMVRGCALIHLRQPEYALRDVEEAHSRREEPTLFPSAIDPNARPSPSSASRSIVM